MSINRSHVPPWLPPDSPSESSIAVRAAGVAWDAIRVPAYLSRPAVDALGAACGAVIWDTWGSVCYWLVPVGTAAGWDVPPTRSCGDAQYVAIPSAGHRSGPGLHWLIPPTEGRVLTYPDRLRDALTAVIDEHLGPREGVAP